MRKRYTLTIITLLFFLFLSCRTSVHDFPFLDMDSKRIELKEYPGIETGSEGKLIRQDDGYSTPLYKLKKHVISLTGSDNASFFIIYSAENEITIKFYYKNDQVAEKTIPALGMETEYVFSLGDFDHFDSFRLFSESDAALEIKCLGLIDETVGVEFGNTLRIAEGYQYSRLKGSIPGHEFRFSTGDIISSQENFSMILNYKFNSTEVQEKSEKLELMVGIRNRTYIYEVTPNPHSGVITLYRGMFPFSPEWVKVRVPDGSGVSVSSFKVLPVSSYEDKPLPADFRSVIDNSADMWRRHEYELYSWSRFPEVLVFDFIDYDTQAKFLKRLAFFVEKRGYSGTVHSNDVIGDLHGWNAHDYRPSDMADFFNKAKRVDFDLNPEEYELRKILLDNGIIIEKQDMYYPGKGAVISVSNETPEALREKLLTHEGSHGIVFVRPQYFEECRKIWDTLSAKEQKFWKIFLAHSYYNINDPYLVVNEFQAYNVQQPIAETVYFFAEWKGPMLAEKYPSRADLINSLILDHPRRFLETAREIDAVLYEYSGCRLGILTDLDLVDVQ